MFRNYLLITLRNLYKNKIYALINILGLGIAVSICFVAYFNHMFGYNFDRNNENFDEIYRVTSNRQMQDRDQEYGLVPLPMRPEVLKELPSVKRAARIMRSYSPVKVGIDNFNRNISYVDEDFLDIFTFHLLSGAKEAIKEPGNVLLSEEVARAHFGKEEAVGQSIIIFNDQNEEFTYTVAGVFEDLPLNSSFRIDILTHIDNFFSMWQVKDDNWAQFARVLFLQVGEKKDIPLIKTGLDEYVQVQNSANESFTVKGFNVFPLKEVHKRSRDTWANGLFPGLHPAAVLAPLIMALTILLIACFNFANTAIASAGKRLMEIGIRKMMGGERKQLLVQFLIENYIVCFLALLVGMAGATILVPAYGGMWEYMVLKFSFTEYPGIWIFLLLLLLVTGFVAGAYPALYISSFNPLKILQSRTRLGRGGPLAKVFLGFQLSISVLAIVSGVIFSRNAVYQETLDLGYERKELIAVDIQREDFKEYYETVSKNPQIMASAGTELHVGFGWYMRSVEDEDQELEVGVMDIGPGYIQTVGMEVIDGRPFEDERVEADRGRSIIVNQKMVQAFGWENPVGRLVRMNDTITLSIIGVVKDFYANGTWSEIEPMMMRLSRSDNFSRVIVRTKVSDVPEVLDYLRETWMELTPNYPFQGIYQEDALEEREINRSIKIIYVFLALVASILSMIGLYTLVSLNIMNRIKEIGIRKVMGSSTSRIWMVLSKGFLMNLAISSVIGCVIGYFLSLALLDSIWDYWLDFTAGIFIFSVLLMLVITVVTITGKIVQAARQNPVDCLRYE